MKKGVSFVAVFLCFCLTACSSKNVTQSRTYVYYHNIMSVAESGDEYCYICTGDADLRTDSENEYVRLYAKKGELLADGWYKPDKSEGWMHIKAADGEYYFLSFEDKTYKLDENKRADESAETFRSSNEMVCNLMENNYTLRKSDNSVEGVVTEEFYNSSEDITVSFVLAGGNTLVRTWSYGSAAVIKNEGIEEFLKNGVKDGYRGSEVIVFTETADDSLFTIPDDYTKIE